MQLVGDFGQRQGFIFRQDLEDRLERAIAARLVEAQLVAMAAPAGECAFAGQ